MSLIERFLDWATQLSRRPNVPPLPPPPDDPPDRRRRDLVDRLSREQERVEQRRRQHREEVEQMLTLAEAEVIALKVDAETAGRFYEPPPRRGDGSGHGRQSS